MTVTESERLRIRAGYRSLQARERPPRSREAAAILEVPEGALADALAREAATVLRPAWGDLLDGLVSCGPVMALSRNDAMVIESVGEFGGVLLSTGGVGQVLGRGIDLRVYLSAWAWAVALEVPSGPRALSSIQVFDPRGDAVHKVYARRDTDLVAWNRLIAALVDPEPEDLVLAPPRALAPIRLPGQFGAEAAAAFLSGWDRLRDTDEFYGLLREHGMGRMEALRLASGDAAAESTGGRPRAQRVEPGTLEKLLRGAAAIGIRLLIFVENDGVHQIHNGPVHRIVDADGWLNVLDPEFNLHVRMCEIGEVWCVRKPTTQGVVTSIEVFGRSGQPLGNVFSKKDRNEAESREWRELVAQSVEPSAGSGRFC